MSCIDGRQRWLLEPFGTVSESRTVRTTHARRFISSFFFHPSSFPQKLFHQLLRHLHSHHLPLDSNYPINPDPFFDHNFTPFYFFYLSADFEYRTQRCGL